MPTELCRCDFSFEESLKECDIVLANCIAIVAALALELSLYNALIVLGSRRLYRRSKPSSLKEVV